MFAEAAWSEPAPSGMTLRFLWLSSLSSGTLTCESIPKQRGMTEWEGHSQNRAKALAFQVSSRPGLGVEHCHVLLEHVLDNPSECMS